MYNRLIIHSLELQRSCLFLILHVPETRPVLNFAGPVKGTSVPIHSFCHQILKWHESAAENLILKKISPEFAATSSWSHGGVKYLQPRSVVEFQHDFERSREPRRYYGYSDMQRFSSGQFCACKPHRRRSLAHNLRRLSFVGANLGSSVLTEVSLL